MELMQEKFTFQTGCSECSFFREFALIFFKTYTNSVYLHVKIIEESVSSIIIYSVVFMHGYFELQFIVYFLNAPGLSKLVISASLISDS